MFGFSNRAKRTLLYHSSTPESKHLPTELRKAKGYFIYVHLTKTKLRGRKKAEGYVLFPFVTQRGSNIWWRIWVMIILPIVSQSR